MRLGWRMILSGEMLKLPQEALHDLWAKNLLMDAIFSRDNES